MRTTARSNRVPPRRAAGSLRGAARTPPGENQAGTLAAAALSSEPPRECPLCPRLAAFRTELRAREPTWHNAPTPNFGAGDARLLIAGLAPGLTGANRTGRPFTGDWAGPLLYATLAEFGFSTGLYGARADDGLELADCLITNVVRCVPPQNRPLPSEVATCRTFLVRTIAGLKRLRCIVALGRVAHESVLRSFSFELARFPFAHGAEHDLEGFGGRKVRLLDSYHCSRQNTSTGVLTPEMFRAVFARARAFLDGERIASSE